MSINTLEGHGLRHRLTTANLEAFQILTQGRYLNSMSMALLYAIIVTLFLVSIISINKHEALNSQKLTFYNIILVNSFITVAWLSNK